MRIASSNTCSLKIVHAFFRCVGWTDGDAKNDFPDLTFDVNNNIIHLKDDTSDS
jgi:hypothetical protein